MYLFPSLHFLDEMLAQMIKQKTELIMVKTKHIHFKVACVVDIKLFFMDWFCYNLIILIK